MSVLEDHAARLVAYTSLDRSYLFEAGAGSGKTSLLAGRVASLLASGVSPRNIVAVSFTELAASELMGRVFDFCIAMAEGRVPMDMAAAFPDGIPAAAAERVKTAIADLGDMTCTTIHGFCQKMLRPYPVEADIDPGASIVDPVEAQMIFKDVLDRWLREKLSGFDADEDIVTAAAAMDAPAAVAMIEAIAGTLRGNPDYVAPLPADHDAPWAAFHDAVDALVRWNTGLAAVPDDHARWTEEWVEAARAVRVQEIPMARRPHMAVIALSGLRAGPSVTTQKGYRKYKMKGAWTPLGKADAESRNNDAADHFQRIAEAFEAMRGKASGYALNMLVNAVRPVIKNYVEHKRGAALLDFDDLLHKTRSLLNDHPAVRESLRSAYTHILVDEYQDTDPIQTDIIEHLCFDLDGRGGSAPRPGGIFFVGDPKQSIYRFRGADVKTYVTTREKMRAHDEASIKSIFVNFRSTPGIIEFVNRTFAEPLAVERQPGFTALSAHRSSGDGPAVMKYRAVTEETIAMKVEMRRRAEADKIADAVAHVMRNHRIATKDGGGRPCEARDIALLAPANTSLFWLENALENHGIPVSTQAGKGLFQQQEVKDLIALTRVIADPRDTLALGALLRGSFFGFTDEELLDAAHSLPAREDGRLPFVTLDVDPNLIGNRAIAGIVAGLGMLREQATTTTPFDVLSAAVDRFDARAKTRNRDESNSARRLANIERYLDMARAYDVRGMRAFSDAMRENWENTERVQEGKPGGMENAVSIITIHSSKGLEWPVVFTVNCGTEFNNRRTVFVDPRRSTFTMKFMGSKPECYEDHENESRAEDEAERMRLMYVGLTRARDLLVVPDLERKTDVKAWCDLVDLGLEALPYLEAEEQQRRTRPLLDNGPTVSSSEYQAIVNEIEENRTRIRRIVPSVHEKQSDAVDRLTAAELADAVPDHSIHSVVQGGAARGNVLHKIMEEILTGETGRDQASVEARAAELARQLVAGWEGEPPVIVPTEIAACVATTLAIPEVAASIDHMVPEVGSSSSIVRNGVEVLTLGVVDALVLMDGRVKAVVDWKSDLHPSAETLAGYKKQVREYMALHDVDLGMIVLMTAGKVLMVTRG